MFNWNAWIKKTLEIRTFADCFGFLSIVWDPVWKNVCLFDLGNNCTYIWKRPFNANITQHVRSES